MVPLFNKIDCLSLPVDDLDTALAFYQHALGHQLIWRDARAAGLRMPGGSGELVLHLDPRPAETDLQVDSVPQAIARICAAGGRLVRGPFDIRIGQCAVVCDPFGNELVILDCAKGIVATDADKNVIGNQTP
jgi:lactoylglutathione lyase